MSGEIAAFKILNRLEWFIALLVLGLLAVPLATEARPMANIPRECFLCARTYRRPR